MSGPSKTSVIVARAAVKASARRGSLSRSRADCSLSKITSMRTRRSRSFPRHRQAGSSAADAALVGGPDDAFDDVPSSEPRVDRDHQSQSVENGAGPASTHGHPQVVCARWMSVLRKTIGGRSSPESRPAIATVRGGDQIGGRVASACSRRSSSLRSRRKAPTVPASVAKTTTE